MSLLEIRSEIQKISEQRTFFKGRCEVLAVSKLQPVEKIKNLIQSGQIHFGENYVQEALEKIEHFQNQNVKWHLIGHLQKNKVKYLEQKFAFIHSVDSLELAQKISAAHEKQNSVQKVLLQVNVAQEASKEGFGENDLISQWSELCKLSGIEIRGLMTMPPLENTAERNRPHFKHLRELLQELQRMNAKYSANLTELSMGTSADYQVAAEEGSTWVRLGTMLFGERPQKQ